METKRQWTFQIVADAAISDYARAVGESEQKTLALWAAAEMASTRIAMAEQRAHAMGDYAQASRLRGAYGRMNTRWLRRYDALSSELRDLISRVL